MIEAIVVGLTVAVVGHVVCFFIQKALDKLWDSHSHSSNDHTVP